VPFVKPVITQLVAGDTTVQVFDGLNTETVLCDVYAVIVTEVVGPTVDEAIPVVGVRVTSVFPAVAAKVPTLGANKFH
jgi:hypothetical protein